MIENEQQLRVSIERIARMYRLQEREASEPLWDAESRAEMAEDTECTRQKIEREVAEYLAKKYALIGTDAKQPEKAA